MPCDASLVITRFHEDLFPEKMTWIEKKFSGNNEKYLSPPAAFPTLKMASWKKNVLEMRRIFLATKVDAEIL